jgi:hypothetical protein
LHAEAGTSHRLHNGVGHVDQSPERATPQRVRALQETEVVARVAGATENLDGDPRMTSGGCCLHAGLLILR